MLKANKLKGKITECGYTQKTFSYELGISENTLRSKLNSRSSFTIGEVEKICKLLGIHNEKELVGIFFSQSGTKQ